MTLGPYEGQTNLQCSKKASVFKEEKLKKEEEYVHSAGKYPALGLCSVDPATYDSAGLRPNHYIGSNLLQ